MTQPLSNMVRGGDRRPRQLEVCEGDRLQGQLDVREGDRRPRQQLEVRGGDRSPPTRRTSLAKEAGSSSKQKLEELRAREFAE